MQRYFMYLIDSTDVLLDPEGTMMPHDAIPQKVLWCARDCIAGDARNGEIDLRYRIDVHDENEEVVYSLPFTEAVRVLV